MWHHAWIYPKMDMWMWWRYQGKMLSNTLIWEKGAIESELESEFAELHALTKLAEAKFAEEYL